MFTTIILLKTAFFVRFDFFVPFVVARWALGVGDWEFITAPSRSSRGRDSRGT
jgi:hypothetical protein